MSQYDQPQYPGMAGLQRELRRSVDEGQPLSRIEPQASKLVCANWSRWREGELDLQTSIDEAQTTCGILEWRCPARLRPALAWVFWGAQMAKEADVLREDFEDVVTQLGQLRDDLDFELRTADERQRSRLERDVCLVLVTEARLAESHGDTDRFIRLSKQAANKAWVKQDWPVLDLSLRQYSRGLEHLGANQLVADLRPFLRSLRQKTTYRRDFIFDPLLWNIQDFR